MTISSNARRKQYTANGSLTTFAYDYEIYANADLNVYVDNTLKALTTHYTVTGVGSNSGGNVVFEDAPTNNAIITIVSNRTIERSTSFATSGVFRAADINDELDKIVSLLKELDTAQERTVRLPVTDGDRTVELPVSATRASKFLSFDTSGDLVTSTTVGEWKGNWGASTAYVKNDIVKDSSNNNIYIALTNYTSGANVAADVSAGNLELVIDVSAATTSATASANSATASANSATASASSASAASTSASNASSSASTATTQKNTATTQASNASTSASAAATSATASANSATGSASSATAAANSATSAASSASAVDGAAIADSGGDTSVEVARDSHPNKVFIRANSVDALTVTESGGTTTSTFSGVLAGTLGTAAQANITSLGTLTALQVDNININANTIISSNTNGNITITPNGNGTVIVSSHLLPASNNAKDIGASGTKFANVYATQFVGAATSALYADLAEIYGADCELEAGDVVKIGGEKEITLCDDVDTMFGVISTKPGFLLNAGADGYPVALKGRVPVKVKGHLSKGQRIILSDEAGIAVGVDLDGLNSLHVIGRANHRRCRTVGNYFKLNEGTT